jgi:hypothetical protein
MNCIRHAAEEPAGKNLSSIRRETDLQNCHPIFRADFLTCALNILLLDV